MPATGRTGRVGFVFSRKLLDRAVDRNRLRRVLREAVRSRHPAMNTFDIVLRLRQPCGRERLRALAAEAAMLLDTLETGSRR